MAQFIRQGQSYFRQDDNGSLYPVTDKETLTGLQAGSLPYNSVGANRALQFGDTGAPKPSTGAPTTVDVGSLIKEKLVGALNNYKGVSDTTGLEAKRQEILRKQMLSSPYSQEGESNLTGAQKLSLLRDKGSEYEPEIKSLEEQILKAKQGDNESLSNISKLLSLAKDAGIVSGGTKRDTSITEANGRRLLVDAQTGETIRDLGSTKNETGDSGLSASVLSKVTTIAQAHDSNQVVKDFNTIQNKSGSMQRILKSGVGGPGDLALVFEFMKALDPTSVVRETEYETAARSGNIFKGAFAKFNGYFKAEGGFLPPEVQKAFIDIMNTKLSIAQTQYENYHKEQARKINKITGKEDGSDYLTDYGQVQFGEAPMSSETKVINGVTYKKVQGGWQKVK